MAGASRKILIVEDNVLIAMEAELLLGQTGCEVVGPVSTVAAGLAAVTNSLPDAALLDINLGRERIWPIAELLDQHGVPFLLTTGYDGSEVPPRFRDRPRLSKPVSLQALQQGLAAIGIVCS